MSDWAYKLVRGSYDIGMRPLPCARYTLLQRFLMPTATVLERIVVRWSIPAIILIGLALISVLWSMTGRIEVALLIIPFSGLPSLVVKPLDIFAVLRSRNVVLDQRGAICRHCRYCLKGLPAAGACPECGREYDLAKTAAAWFEYYAVDEDDLRRAEKDAASAHAEA